MAYQGHLPDEFVAEAREHLAAFEECLLGLEKMPGAAADWVARCFRAVHTVKGGAGFFGYHKIAELAHALETVLEEFRSRGHQPGAAEVDALLSGADHLMALLDDIEHSNAANIGPTLEQVQRLLHAIPSAPTHRYALKVDLAQRWRTQGESPVAFVRQLAGLGCVRGGELRPTGAGLGRPLPLGPLIYAVILDSKQSLGEVTAGLKLTGAELRVLEPGAATLPARFLYTLRLDFVEHARQHGENPIAFLRQLAAHGQLLDGQLKVAPNGLEDPLSTEALPFRAFYATDADEATLAKALGFRTVYLRLVADRQAPPPEAPVDKVPAPPAEPARPARPEPLPAGAETERVSTIRINVGLLDRLMTLAGELVLVRNQAMVAADPEDARLRPILNRLNGVTADLQETVLRTRMQPVGNLFSRFPRLVRDLAKQLGKEIELTIVGQDVELDKSILESLSDPLIHLVRNSADHGIELPQVRQAAGKPATGHITLSARHESGRIRIEIADDGKGIDPAAVRRKALDMGLKTEAELAFMSPREVLSLILLPGFSTAQRVTDVSGRGVGMDVVKTNLDTLGGSIEIDSTPGAGTCMVLRLPLTLAIIPCLVVAVDGERFAIPQKDLEEVVCLPPEAAAAKIEAGFDQEVYRLRQYLLPLVRMNEVLERPQPFTPATHAEILHKYHGSPSGKFVSFAVVRAGTRRFGLIVDAILGTEEIVVKPMQSLMKALRCFSGATIRGDGRVALICDTEGIARHVGLRFEAGTQILAKDVAPAVGGDEQTVLLFEYGPREQFAVSLGQVRRLEWIATNRIEQVGVREFIIVDGVATAILRLDKLLCVSGCAPRERMYLLLPRHVRQPVGVLVSRILDIETVVVELQAGGVREEGILGSAVVNNRLTLFLEFHRLVEKAMPEAQPARPRGGKQILLVEDSPFFRQLVSGYLTGAGYKVVLAEHGREGLKKLDEQPFDLVISDIEMPVMDGWAFARALRERPDGASLPLLALTSLGAAADRARALECGYDRYEIKLDRDALYQTVADLLANKGGAHA